jgi:hypothetical protein
MQQNILVFIFFLKPILALQRPQILCEIDEAISQFQVKPYELSCLQPCFPLSTNNNGLNTSLSMAAFS